MPSNAPFDALKPFSFNGFAFPYTTYSVQGGIRKHNHEYSHNPGAAVEKLGRQLYEIHVSANFTGGLVDPRYPSLLTDLDALRSNFEAQSTGPLTIPHIGTIQACAERWNENVRNTNRSTVQADFTFYEDLNSALQLQDQLSTSSGAIGSLGDNLFQLTKTLDPVVIPTSFTAKPIGPNVTSLWDAINDLSVTIAGIQDQSDLYGALVESKIDGLIALCKQADQFVSALNDPDNWPVLDALHSLWSAALDLQGDLQNTGFQSQLYGVPVRMGIADVSIAIYGNTLAAASLMQLNAIDDPLNIPAGTTILYYPGLAA